MVRGIRVFPNKFGFLRLPEGGYGRDMDGKWWCRPPEASTQRLKNYVIEEHEDDSVTIAKPINSGGGVKAFTLEHGVWLEA